MLVGILTILFVSEDEMETICAEDERIGNSSVLAKPLEIKLFIPAVLVSVIIGVIVLESL